MTARAMTAAEILSAEYGAAPNFMTPERLRIGKAGRDTAWELSAGDGLKPGTRIYGVSVVRVIDHAAKLTERDHDRSRCEHDLADALAYVRELQLTTRYREELDQ